MKTGKRENVCEKCQIVKSINKNEKSQGEIERERERTEEKSYFLHSLSHISYSTTIKCYGDAYSINFSGKLYFFLLLFREIICSIKLGCWAIGKLNSISGKKLSNVSEKRHLIQKQKTILIEIRKKSSNAKFQRFGKLPGSKSKIIH